jgi:hypothetical protein
MGVPENFDPSEFPSLGGRDIARKNFKYDSSPLLTLRKLEPDFYGNMTMFWVLFSTSPPIYSH